MSAPQSPRILSFQQIVLEADPNWNRDYIQPWIYSFSNRRLFYATLPTYGIAPGTNLGNDGDLAFLLDPSGYPLSSAGLPPGAVYNLGGAIGIVPGKFPRFGVPGLFFGSVTASQLLLFGGGDLPRTQPGPGTFQLWNDGGLVAIGPLTAAPPDFALGNDSGVLYLTEPANYPTSSSGLPVGAVYSNGNVINIVPGSTPRPNIPGLFFGDVTAAMLLRIGGGDLPISEPTPGSLQLWNNGGIVCIA